ncbi:MAG TPA: PAS domain S-box protein [Anaerolineales bacterium]|nr:PAS domain S-box protein [Anaerolineales bacterium]
MKRDRKIKVRSGSDELKMDGKSRRASSKSASKSNGKQPLASYEHIPIGIVESSPGGKYVNVNEEFCRITGYKRQELLKLGIIDITHEDDYTFDIKLHEQLVAGKIPFYKIEKRVKRKDGGVVWVELTRSVVRDPQGEAIYTIGAVLDSSDHKHVERGLHESAERLRLATEAARMFTWEWDFRNQTYTLSDSFVQMLGFSAGLLPKNSIDVVLQLSPAEDVQAISAAIAKAIEDRADLHSLQYRVINPENGQTVWLEVNGKIVYDDEGNAMRMFGVAQNITENKKAEAALQLARRQAEQSADRTARLQKVTAALSEALTPPQVAEVVVNQGAPAFGAVSSSVLQLSEDGQILEIMYSTSPASIIRPYKRFPVSLRVPAADAARSGQPVWIESQQQYLERYPHLADQINLWGQQSGIAIPMEYKGRILGVLTLSFDRVLAYSLEDRDYALTLARQGAQALERARADDALRESEERYRFIVENTSDGIWRIEMDEPLPISLPEDQQLEWYYQHAVIRQCNLGLARMYGYASVEEVVGLPLRVVMPSGNPVNLELARQFIHSGYRLVDAESREVGEDGRELVFLNNMIGIIEAGKLKGEWGTNRDITERKRAEEALRESEERFRAILRQATAGIVRKDAEGKLTFVNQAFCNMLGYTESELLGKTVWDLTHEDDIQENKRLYDRLIMDGIPFKLEKRLIREDGSVIWVDVSVSPVMDAAGKPQSAVAVEVDITGRKLAEEALHRNEKMFSTLIDAAPFGVYFIDSEFRLRAINKGSESVFSGIYPLIGRDFAEILRLVWEEPFATEAIERFRHTLRTGESFISPPVIEKRANIEEIQAYDWQIHRITLSDGTFGAVCYFYDLSEQKRMEAAVRVSEELYRNLFDLVPVAVYACDANGLIQEYNHRAVELWGREPAKNEPNEKFCGSFKLYYPDGRLMLHEECPMARALSGERLEPHEFEMLVERQDGRRRNVVAHPLVWKDEQGQVSGAINCLYDITDRKQAEEALRELNLQLENRVQHRTARLNDAIQTLRDEIAERRKVEDALRKSEASARENEEKLSTLFELLPVGISFLDLDGQIIQMNSALANILKLPKEQLSNQEYKSRKYIRANGALMPPTAFASQRALAEGKTIYNIETGVVLENSEVVWTSVSAAPVEVADVGAVVVTVDITESKRAERALRESRERLQLLSQRLVEVQEDERRAIARELHDRVGQTLAALNINLIIISDQLTGEVDEQIGARLNDSVKLVAETISLVRDVMSNLRPAVLDDYGLEAALQSHLSEYMLRYEIKVVMEKAGHSIPRLGPSIEMTFLRIAQEALMNIARHAQASHVTLSLWREGNAICMTVQDNGTGIRSWQDANRPGSHGLTIMRERAEAFGGSLKVGSVPGEGTRVEVSIPFENSNPPQVQNEMPQ